MRKILLIAALYAIAAVAHAGFDVNTGVISNETWRSGVPLGGIGCGKLEIVTDGSFGYYTGNNNWDRPTGILKGVVAAVFAQVGDKKAARMLRLAGKNEYAGVENISGVEYSGWFPTASLKFRDPALPVNVELLAWSPLIPNNIADSALPVACFRFAITNPTKQSGRAVVLMSWPNIVGWGGSSRGKWDDLAGNSQNREDIIKKGDLGALVYEKPEMVATQSGKNALGKYALCAVSQDVQVGAVKSYDAAGETLPFWETFSKTGNTKVEMPSGEPKEPAGALAIAVNLKPRETRYVQFILVWHFPDHITVHEIRKPTDVFVAVPENVELAFDGKPDTRWSTEHPMLPGEMYQVDMGRECAIARIILDSRDSPDDYPRGYRIELSNDGNNWRKVAEASRKEAERLQKEGKLEIIFPEERARFIRITQKGKETYWYWSIHEIGVEDASGKAVPTEDWKATAFTQKVEIEKKEENVGHYYSKRFKNPLEIARYVAANSDRLLGETMEWQNLARKSNLPSWLKLKLINCTFSMYACTILTRDGRFVVQESPVDMNGATGTMDQRMAAHAFYTQMFPELDENELRLYAKCQDLVTPVADGRITHFDGNIHDVIGDPNVSYGITDWPDLSSSWIMQVLKLYRWTGDKTFVSDMWPHVKRALAWLESADSDGDLIPEGGSTYDYESLPRGAFCYNASCYLGALRAGIHLARIQHDPAAEKVYTERFQSVRQSIMKNLWNGKFFIKHLQPKTGRKNPNSFIAQLAGDWLSRLSAAGRTLSPEVTDSAIREVIARHVKPFYPVPPMEVTPEGELATDRCFIIQHEPYAGCEAINEGYTDDGLDVIKRVYDVAWLVNHNPWHESLSYTAPTGQQGGLVSYMTCPTTWHVLNALSGSTLDLPAKTLYISPRIGKSVPELHIPLFFSRFWLWMDYAPAKKSLGIKVLKVFGNPPVIEKIASDSEARPIKLPKPFVLKQGASLDLSAYISKLVVYPKPK